MPHDLPPWDTVHYYRRFRLEGVWGKMHEVLRDQVRVQAGRETSPSAAVIDSQTVKTTEKGGSCGYDAGKKVKGRKRHMVVDTMGMILVAVVHSAALQDRDGAQLVWERLKDRFARLKLIWADGGYRGKRVVWTKKSYHWVLKIVKRHEDVSGFEVLPKRWMVERTFAGLGRYRRLAKDYEEKTESSETMILLAMINLMSRRLANEKIF